MESLPKGLVTTFPRVPSHLGDPDVVEAGDIVQLWKVYHTNPAIHQNDSGHRLENFFWRVWSSERLRSSSQGSTLARLFVDIAESQAVSSKLMPESLQKMAPDSATKSFISYNTSNNVIDAHAQILQNPPTPATETSEKQPDDNPTRNANSRSNSDPIPNTNTRSPLPPILKKPKSINGNESSQKKARLLLTGLGGQHVTRKPSNPLTPISPPPFAAVSNSGDADTTSTTSTSNTNTNTPSMNTSTRSQHQHQKRPYFVASKTSKRRPVLVRRKSSQTSVPSLVRPEARGDYFGQENTNQNTKTTVGLSRDDDLKEQGAVEPVDHENKASSEDLTHKESLHSEAVPSEQENYQKVKQNNPSLNESQLPDGKYMDLEDHKQFPKNLVSDLKLLLTQKHNPAPTRSTPKPARPKHTTFPSTTTTNTNNHRHDRDSNHLRRLKSTTYMQMHMHHHQPPPPTKLVDDHFRVRFVEELQREEKFLNAVNSLPEEERNAVLEGHSGRSRVPKFPKTTWVVVPDDEAAAEKIKVESPTVHNNEDDNDEWAFTGDGEDGAGGWMADDAQDHYTDTQVDAIPFKFEGMSYASSWRAACRLQVPGQLTVLLRAEQYGYRADAGIVDST